TTEAGFHALADQAVCAQSPRQVTDDRCGQDIARGTLREVCVHAGAGADEPQPGDQFWPLLIQGGGDPAAGRVADHDGSTDAEAVQCSGYDPSLSLHAVVGIVRLG